MLRGRRRFLEAAEVAEIVGGRRGLRRIRTSWLAAGGGAAAGAGGAVSAFEAVGVPSGIAPRSALTPRPTRTPHRKITTDTTVAAMNRNTSCLPFSWISWKPSS